MQASVWKLTAESRKLKANNGRAVSGAAEAAARGGRERRGAGGRELRRVAARGGRGAARLRRPLPPLQQAARRLGPGHDVAQAARKGEPAARLPPELAARAGGRHLRRVPR